MVASVDENTEETNPHSNSLLFSLVLPLPISIPYHTSLTKFNFSTNQHISFYISNATMAIQSVKQAMSAISAVVAVDYVSRIAMDMVSVEVKGIYLKQMTDYVKNTYDCGVDSIISIMGNTHNQHSEL